DDILDGTILKRLFDLINVVPQEQNNAVAQIEQAQQRNKTRHDQRLKSSQSFAIGDKVLLYRAYLIHSRSHKLDNKWEGPFFCPRSTTQGGIPSPNNGRKRASTTR
ncbi:13950_t:CDS:1, partial [Acaulospora morrowiae]